MRKFWFAYLAKALVIFPGGFGTLDEMFEILTLAQTDKLSRKLAVILYGREYWEKVLDLEPMAEWGAIAEEDKALLHRADTPDEAFGLLDLDWQDHVAVDERYFRPTEVHVLQGERPMARDNRTLGRFHLDGIPPAPRGVPQVEVTFDIDANGILNVSARDKATAKQQNITITASSGLTKDEIDRMKKEAEAHAADDAKSREAIEVKNHCDSLVYSTERTLRDHGDKVPAEDKQAIEAAMGEAREALKGDDLDRIKRAQEALTKASHKLAEVMYREAQASAQPPGGQTGPGDGAGAEAPKSDVIDAEFKDLGDKK